MKIICLIAIISSLCSAEDKQNERGLGSIPLQHPFEKNEPMHEQRELLLIPPTPTRKHPKAYFNPTLNKWIRLTVQEYLEMLNDSIAMQ